MMACIIDYRFCLVKKLYSQARRNLISRPFRPVSNPYGKNSPSSSESISAIKRYSPTGPPIMECNWRVDSGGATAGVVDTDATVCVKVVSTGRVTVSAPSLRPCTGLADTFSVSAVVRIFEDDDDSVSASSNLKQD